ncbi:unnamed protein product [marine sediment metagenome]|uniref:Uncharacterized protein n=1 Tax=marine sediment metagenome TaxID=412755 RepID=X1F6C2_9ZZZZ
MTSGQLCVVVKRAISKVIADFQSDPERFWNERDMHWSLFYYLKQVQVCEEAYPTQLIRAEFPTLKVFNGKKPARGHYDLVLLDAKSYFKPEVQNMKAQAPWKEYLELVQIAVAIEVKLWLNRLRPENMAERADWDIKKLTDTPNNVKNAYFLNFVQLDFNSEYMRDYYRQLREYLGEKKGQHPELHILCVPSDSQFQINTDNWL